MLLKNIKKLFFKKKEVVDSASDDDSVQEKQPEIIQESIDAQDPKIFRLYKINCSTCGGTINIEEGMVTAVCQFCGNRFTVTKESPDFVIDRGVLVKYCGESREVEVPYGVKAIGMLAFYQQTSITKITLPEGVTELQGTFYNCYDLETIILPDSLENIPPIAFQGCINLKSIALPPNLKFLGSMAFAECKSLISIEIPPKTKFVDTFTFRDCESLETISYYENTKIKGNYFDGCESLVSINMLDSKTKEVISKKKIFKDEYGYYKIENEEHE